MSESTFSLTRNAFGYLVLERGGVRYERVMPVRAFPLAAPAAGVSLVAESGEEVVWIDHLDQLSSDVRTLIEEDLAGREFMPEILRIVDVSSFATPSTWRVETDRGATSLILKGEDDIRHLAGNALLIADSNGIQFWLRDPQCLDRTSRKFLDRFL
jgi:hypothetical protein